MQRMGDKWQHSNENSQDAITPPTTTIKKNNRKNLIFMGQYLQLSSRHRKTCLGAASQRTVELWAIHMKVLVIQIAPMWE